MESADDTNDYHKLPEPKGPSAVSRHVNDVSLRDPAMTPPQQRQVVPPDETDSQRWARVKVQGYLGMRPADFEWLLGIARDKIF